MTLIPSLTFTDYEWFLIKFNTFPVLFLRQRLFENMRFTCDGQFFRNEGNISEYI